MKPFLRQRRPALTTLGLTVVSLAFAGCGEDPVTTPTPTCTSEDLIAIVGPAPIVSTDVDAAAAGVQTSVAVRTSFPAGIALTLTVTADSGGATETTTATTDATGAAMFAAVTVPAGGAELRVAGGVADCPAVEDARHIEVVAGAGCELAFPVAPVATPFYAPLAVFAAAADADAVTAGFQGEVVVRSLEGFSVTLYRSGAGVIETAVATGVMTGSGELHLPVSLPEGQVNLRAECAGPDGVGSRASLATSVYVDTVAPACAIASPVPGTSLTPSLDDDQDLANGLQLALTGRVTGADVAGEPASFVLTAPDGATTTLAASAVDDAGAASANATFAPAAPPVDYGVAFAGRDHAGNTCGSTRSYRVVYDGCAIDVVAPVATVTTDADGNAANGAQVDLALAIDAACAGRAVTSDCGSTDVGGTVGAGGATVLRASVCDVLPCEASEHCTLHVTSPDGIETTAGVDLGFDNQAPNVGVQVALPSGVTCGGTVTPEQDLDAGTAGTQVRIRVVSPTTTDRQLRRTSLSGTATYDASTGGGEVAVTIEAGANDFVGVAHDAVGNTATSTTCRVTLADIAVGFTGSPADGTVGPIDGTGGDAGSLSFTLTGTTSASGAAVAVTIDGGAALPATVSGGTWSLALTLAGRAAPYALVATATTGTRIGAGALALTVDLTPPPVVGNLTGAADTRRSLRLRFTAPGDGGQPAAAYRVRYATTALTDANFDTTGTAFTPPTPGAPGAAEVVRVVPARTGTTFWVGIAAVDGAGNRSAAQIVGPLTPAFDGSAPYAAPATGGFAGLGYAIVHGRFNDDGFEDVAIAAPFVTAGGVAGAGEVYVYFGSATGLAAAPSVTIRGTTADAGLGSSLARVQWSSASRDDLAIGEPFSDGGNGRIFVFQGGAAFPTGTVLASTAPTRIGVHPVANWFSGSALGWTLASADHDGDGTDDLVTTAVFGAGGSSGAALVFYGGTVPTGNVLISDTTAVASGTAIIRMYEEVGFGLFGFYLHNLGPTQGPTDAADDLGVAFVEDGVPGGEVVVLRASGGRPANAGVNPEPFTIGRDVRLHYTSSDDLLEWGSTMGSIADQNGDGARDLVLGDYRDGADAGVVFVVDGDTVGTAGVAEVSAVAITSFAAAGAGNQLGMAVLNNARDSAPDVDGDGFEDLVFASRVPGQARAQLQVWFGPIPHGSVAASTADHVVVGPASFAATPPNNGGSAIAAIWAGDVNGDGLHDICWADQSSAARDGSFQVLWDDGN